MRAFSYALSLIRSRDKDGGHTIRSVLAENPTQTSWLYVLLNRSYCWSKFYIAGIGIFDPCAPVTLTLTRWRSFVAYERDLYSLKVHLMCKYKLLHQGFRKLSADRQTRLL